MKQDNTPCYREKHIPKMKSSLQEIFFKMDISTTLTDYCHWLVFEYIYNILEKKCQSTWCKLCTWSILENQQYLHNYVSFALFSRSSNSFSLNCCRWFPSQQNFTYPARLVNKKGVKVNIIQNILQWNKLHLLLQ